MTVVGIAPLVKASHGCLGKQVLIDVQAKHCGKRYYSTREKTTTAFYQKAKANIQELLPIGVEEHFQFSTVWLTRPDQPGVALSIPEKHWASLQSPGSCYKINRVRSSSTGSLRCIMKMPSLLGIAADHVVIRA